MDYAIYKTTDGKQKRVIHRFTQADNNHRALVAARAKLDEMGRRVLQSHNWSNPEGSKDRFGYDCMTSAATKERIEFFIDKL